MKRGRPSASSAASARTRRSWLKREHYVWMIRRIEKRIQGDVRMEAVSVQFLAGAHDENLHLLDGLAELAGETAE